MLQMCFSIITFFFLKNCKIPSVFFDFDYHFSLRFVRLLGERNFHWNEIYIYLRKITREELAKSENVDCEGIWKFYEIFKR